MSLRHFARRCSGTRKVFRWILYIIIKGLPINALIQGKPYPLDSQQVSDLFMIFNVSGDGSMSMQEFVYCWNGWITKIVKPKSALVVVDVQNDFISGSLAIKNCPAGQNGEEVAIC